MGQGFLYGRQRESVETVIDNNDTLHSQVDALVGYLYTKANYLNRKRRSKNLVSYWKARGSQQTLRRIAAQLTAMRTRYHNRYALVQALQDYLHCLEKNVDDAKEETRISRLNRRTPIERWKAEGEAQTLPSICASLSRLVHHYAPAILHALSLDGETLVPLFGRMEQDPFVENTGWWRTDDSSAVNAPILHRLGDGHKV